MLMDYLSVTICILLGIWIVQAMFVEIRVCVQVGTTWSIIQKVVIIMNGALNVLHVVQGATGPLSALAQLLERVPRVQHVLLENTAIHVEIITRVSVQNVALVSTLQLSGLYQAAPV